MKNKGLFIFVLFLFLISAICGGVGFLTSKTRTTTNKPTPEKQGQITYKYYLEDLEVAQIPTNEKKIDENGYEVETKSYELLNFSCTNGVTGKFDEETWTFIPENEKESVCQLYFVNTKYRVDFTPIINAKADENNPLYIKRDENGVFKFIPDEGYQFNKTECTDNKETIWNEQAKEITINAINKDITCKILFEIQEVKANIKVNNGDGTTTEIKKFGEKVQVIVKPKDGYEKPTIKCTNNQIATFKDNTLIIDKLTNNTDCTVDFVKKPIKKYNLSLILPGNDGEYITIISGAKTQQIDEGKTGTFTLKINERYDINSVECTDNIMPESSALSQNEIKYSILNMNRNITCNISVKERN